MFRAILRFDLNLDHSRSQGQLKKFDFYIKLEGLDIDYSDFQAYSRCYLEFFAHGHSQKWLCLVLEGSSMCFEHF